MHGIDRGDGVPIEYQYDNLNRLSSVATVSDVPTGTLYSYDDIGNLTGHGASVTTYFSNTPHLVQHVDDNLYLNDPNGNVSFRGGPAVPGGGQALYYTPFNLPKRIVTNTSNGMQ